MTPVPTRSSGVMTCLARARVGRAQWNTQARKEGWFSGERGRRFMELAFCAEHARLSPGWLVINVFGD